VRSTHGEPFVPPGYGKATTHARNLRRKRLRAAQTQQRAESVLQQAPASHILSLTNTIPLGERFSSQTTEYKGNEEATIVITDEEAIVEEGIQGVREVMMASLGNKNKKKGFKKFLSAPVPKKIVFTEDGQPTTVSIPAPVAQSSVSQLRISKDESSPPESQKSRPRLIPPSEIQERGELPLNMFVTSVDVEAGLWNSSGKKRKRKDRNKGVDDSHDYEYSYVYESGCQAEEDATVSSLDEGHESSVRDVDGDAQSAGHGMPAFDWSRGEQLFESGSKVSQVGDLRTGQIVGWKVRCSFFRQIFKL